MLEVHCCWQAHHKATKNTDPEWRTADRKPYRREKNTLKRMIEKCKTKSAKPLSEDRLHILGYCIFEKIEGAGPYGTTGEERYHEIFLKL